MVPMSASFESNGKLPIVLTATITPNVAGAVSVNPETRLAEYIEALKFYLQFAPVIFLENSGYPLENHAEFRESPRLLVRKFLPSTNPGRGKGYQEFEMLDAWLDAESQPPARWLKITGRYQILNIQSLLDECRQDPDSGLIIDQIPRADMARTYSFCVSTDFYRKRIRGLYRQCDDRSGAWIERILFRELKGASAKEVRLFKTQPRITAIAGSSGAAFPTGRGQWLVKQILRRLNRFFDGKYLWYSK
jgi:hypothetical protein